MYRHKEEYLLLDVNNSLVLLDAILRGELDGKKPCIVYGDVDKPFPIDDLLQILSSGLAPNLQEAEHALSMGDYEKIRAPILNCHKLKEWVIRHIDITDAAHELTSYKKFQELTTALQALEQKLQVQHIDVFTVPASPAKPLTAAEMLMQLLSQGKNDEANKFLEELDVVRKIEEKTSIKNQAAESQRQDQYLAIIEDFCNKLQYGYVAVTPHLHAGAGYTFAALYIKLLYTSDSIQKKHIEEEIAQSIPEDFRTLHIAPIFKTHHEFLATPPTAGDIEFLKDMESYYYSVSSSAGHPNSVSAKRTKVTTVTKTVGSQKVAEKQATDPEQIAQSSSSSSSSSEVEPLVHGEFLDDTEESLENSSNTNGHEVTHAAPYSMFNMFLWIRTLVMQGGSGSLGDDDYSDSEEINDMRAGIEKMKNSSRPKDDSDSDTSYSEEIDMQSDAEDKTTREDALEKAAEISGCNNGVLHDSPQRSPLGLSS